MTLFTTSVKAICPHSGELKTYGGQHVLGLSYSDAQMWCDANGLGYLKVDGILVAEVPCKPDGTADMGKIRHYNNQNN